MILIGCSCIADFIALCRLCENHYTLTLSAEKMEQQLTEQQLMEQQLMEQQLMEQQLMEPQLMEQQLQKKMWMLHWIGIVMTTVGFRLVARRRIRRNAKAAKGYDFGMRVMMCGVCVYVIALFFKLFTTKVVWKLFVFVGNCVFGFGYLQAFIMAPMEALSPRDYKKNDDDGMTSSRHYGVHTQAWKQQKRGQRHLPRSWTFLFRRHHQHTASPSLL